MQPIPLNNRANIALASATTGVSIDEINDKIIDAAKLAQQKENKQWAISFFDKDEQWYDKTLEKVQQLNSALDKDMDYMQKTIKLYGWIAKEIPEQYFSIPMQTNQEYATARCIELILTNPSEYLKIISWD
jgi:hypothetical protein